MSNHQIILKTAKEIESMREAGAIVCSILDSLESMVEEGISTMDLEMRARALCKEYKVQPAFLGYYGYPAVLCTSVNEEVVHGIPSPKKILHNGDIVSIDMGVILNGYFGDSARTCVVGTVNSEIQHLIDKTRHALDVGINKMVSQGSLSELSSSIYNVAYESGLGVVRDYSGHGIGRNLHEPPSVYNYVPHGYKDIKLEIGMVLAIEPMFTLGSHEVNVLNDKWTVVTRDNSYSAHFEHTVAITEEGPKVLTI